MTDELKRLSRGRGRKARYAGLALELASKFRVLPSGSASVDDEVVSSALDRSAVVATADGSLARNLRALKVTVIGLRSGRAGLL